MFPRTLVAQLSLLYSVLGAVVVVVCGWLFSRGGRQELLASQRRELEHRAEVIRVKLQSEITSVTGDIRYLSRNPAIQRMLGAAPQADLAADEAELRESFRSLLLERPAYFQVRLIGAENNGLERVRIDQENGRLKEITGAGLQQKGTRDYFQETVRLPDGEFYLSEINLNQEFGKISEPKTPTLRAAAPLRRRDGQLHGILVINVDVSGLFADIVTLGGQGFSVRLCNAAGDYLLHPDTSKTFGFDLGKRHLLREDLPVAETAANGQVQQGETDDELYHVSRFPLTPQSGRSLILAVALPKAALLQRLAAHRNRSIFLTACVGLATVLAVFTAAKTWSRRLHQISTSMEHYSAGQPAPALPLTSRDEIGTLARKFSEMAGKISEQVRNLEEAKSRAEAATKAREEFLATMSHEIRTPMNGVLGMTWLLDQSSPTPQQREWIATLRFSGQHLMALLNNVLDSDRIRAGEILFADEEISLGELLRNLHASHAPLAQRKGLALKLEPSPALPSVVRGDPVRIYQILSNLLHNAVKFTDQGTVALSAAPISGGIRFVIADTGRGLPPHILQRLADPGARQAGAGGLGLLISRGLVELLHGSLRVVKSGADGTTFEADIPMAAQEGPEQVRDTKPAAPPSLDGKSLLVVEDVSSNQAVIGALLERTRAVVSFAATLLEAREKMLAGKFDALLIDLQLPDGSGADFAREQRPENPDLPMLAVTAQTGPSAVEHCRAAGMNGVVHKPVEPRELYARLAEIFPQPDAASAPPAEASADTPDLSAIRELFDGDAIKVRDYQQLLAQEIDGFAVDLEKILPAKDAAALGKLHHRMKNALGQLNLTGIDQEMNRLRSGLATQSEIDGAAVTARLRMAGAWLRANLAVTMQ